MPAITPEEKNPMCKKMTEDSSILTINKKNKKTRQNPVLKHKQCSETYDRECNVRPKIDYAVSKKIKKSVPMKNSARKLLTKKMEQFFTMIRQHL